MGTRIIDPQPLVFDHAAQFFTVSDPMFAELVDGWSKKGLVRHWQGTIGDLEAGGQFTPLPSSPPRYIAVNGMRPLADSILSQVSYFYFCLVFFFFYDFLGLFLTLPPILIVKLDLPPYFS